MLGSVINHACVRLQMIKTSLIRTKHHRVFHNLHDANRRWVFQVKALGLGGQISYSYWWFLIVLLTKLMRELILIKAYFFDSNNTRICCRPNFFSTVRHLSYPQAYVDMQAFLVTDDRCFQ